MGHRVPTYQLNKHTTSHRLSHSKVDICWCIWTGHAHSLGCNMVVTNFVTLDMSFISSLAINKWITVLHPVDGSFCNWLRCNGTIFVSASHGQDNVWKHEVHLLICLGYITVYGTTAVFAQFPILALTSVLLQLQLVCPCTCVPVACVDKARGMVTSQDSCRVVRLCCNDLGNLWCPIYSTHKMGLIRK